MFKKIAVLFLIAVFAVSIYGCATMLSRGKGFKEATWVLGKLVQEVEAPMDKTVQSTKMALNSLKLKIVKESKKKKVAQIISKYTDGKTIWIDINQVSASKSLVEVRVGLLFNKAGTEMILKEIKKFANE